MLGRSILGKAQFDDGLGYSEMSNAGPVWGAALAGRYQNTGRRWPTGDNVRYLLWLGGHGLYIAAKPEPRLPRPEEVDQAIRDFIETRRSRAS
jgi:hypothetical protein